MTTVNHTNHNKNHNKYIKIADDSTNTTTNFNIIKLYGTNFFG